MDWLDRCKTGNYRDFDFLTDSHSAKGGRRKVQHEFPGRDDSETEDMGEKAWDYTLNAYFVGPDYDLERNAFIKVLNQPQADWLMHPWFGLRWVESHTWEIHESNERGGYCTVVVTFIPGSSAPDAPTVDMVDDAEGKTDDLADAAEEDFELEPMSADGMTEFIAAVHDKLEGLRKVIALATLPLTWANQVMSVIQGIKGDLDTLMAIPGQYAAALRSLMGLLGGGYDDLSDSDRPRVVSRITSTVTRPTVVDLTGAAANDGAVKRNLLQEEAVRGRLLITAAANVALATYNTAEDRDNTLKTVVQAIDALLPSMSDPVFQAAVSARAAIIDALLAQDLDPATSRDIVKPLPATVLAHRLEVDEATFIAQNNVRHPLFVQGTVYA